MENPESWTDIHKTIRDAIEEFNKNYIFGPSLVAQIYNALKEKGHLDENQASSSSNDN
jgi:hypothetical protein